MWYLWGFSALQLSSRSGLLSVFLSLFLSELPSLFLTPTQSEIRSNVELGAGGTAQALTLNYNFLAESAGIFSLLLLRRDVYGMCEHNRETE